MKSSKTFCFVELRARLVPVLAVLAAAPQVGQGIEAAHLHPGQGARAEARRERDVEPAVAVEQGRGIARRASAPSCGSGTSGPAVPSLLR